MFRNITDAVHHSLHQMFSDRAMTSSDMDNWMIVNDLIHNAPATAEFPTYKSITDCLNNKDYNRFDKWLALFDNQIWRLDINKVDRETADDYKLRYSANTQNNHYLYIIGDPVHQTFSNDIIIHQPITFYDRRIGDMLNNAFGGGKQDEIEQDRYHYQKIWQTVMRLIQYSDQPVSDRLIERIENGDMKTYWEWLNNHHYHIYLINKHIFTSEQLSQISQRAEVSVEDSFNPNALMWVANTTA